MDATLEKAVRLARVGAFSELVGRGRGWIRRRRYRLQARLEAMGADIELVDPPTTWIAGCAYTVKVRIRNRSRIAWNSKRRKPLFTIALSLRVPSGEIIEKSRCALPGDFKSGDVAIMDLPIDLPLATGEARIRLDLIRESCYWFSEIGQPPFEAPVRLIAHDDDHLREHLSALDVTMDITNRCPLRCIQCRKTTTESPEDQGEMDRALYDRIASDLFPRARSLMLSSAGEPMMAGYLMEALDVARGHGVRGLAFNTSGLLLDRHRAERLVELGIDRIEFSVDGASAEVYNAIRVRSDFDQVVKNIAHLGLLKARRRRRLPLIRLNFVLMRRNVHELPDLIDLAARIGAEEVQCQHLVVFSPALRDEALIHDRERSNRMIEEAQRRARDAGVRFYHPPFFRIDGSASPLSPGSRESSEAKATGDIWEAEDGGLSFARKTHAGALPGMPRCMDPWRKVYLDWQGLVFPCCVWKEAPLGDLSVARFDEIWNSERYRRLRASLLSGPLGRSCSECSAITGGDVNDERSYFFIPSEA